MTQPVQLLGSFWTLAVGADPKGEQSCSHDFRLRVQTAGQAGFTAMGFWHTDLRRIREKYSFVEMKHILDGHGITHIELEWLLDWFCTDQRRVVSDETRTLLLAITVAERTPKYCNAGITPMPMVRTATQIGSSKPPMELPTAAAPRKPHMM